MEKKSSGKKSANVLVDAKHGVAYLPNIDARIVFKKGETLPIAGVETVQNGNDDMMIWGDGNDLPNKWEQEVENDDTLRDAIEKTIDHLYGGGLEYGYETLDENNERVFVRHFDPIIETFLQHPMTAFAFEQLIRDYKIHNLPVPQIIISVDGTAMVDALPAAHFRWAKQDNLGWINFGYFNRNWHLGRNSKSVDTKKFAVIDPLIDTIEGVKATKIKNFVYKVPMASYRTYYPLAPVYSAKTSKWLDIKSKLTMSFDASLDNQMSPKYHIEVDDMYMANKYKKRWTSATERELEAIMIEELEHFHAMLHGVGNTGKNIITTKKLETAIKQEYSSWTITDLKGTVFEKGHIELGREADSHIRQAAGLDKTLQGAGSSSGMGAGSGSDKREAFNIRMATSMRHLRPILGVFDWVFEYNGFKGPKGEKIKAIVITPFLQTQNNVTPSQRENSIPQ
jgi:hypothetical protein